MRSARADGDVTDRRRGASAFARRASGSGPSTFSSTTPARPRSARLPTPMKRSGSEMIGVNLTGTYRCMRAVLPGMLAARTAAASSTSPARRACRLSVCGCLLRGQARSDRVDARAGARGGDARTSPSSGLPGLHGNRHRRAMRSPPSRAKTGRTEGEARDALAARNPQQRLVQPEEVAKAVLVAVPPGHASGSRARASRWPAAR